MAALSMCTWDDFEGRGREDTLQFFHFSCSAFGKLTWKVTEEKKSRGGGVGGAGGAGQLHPHSSRLNTAILKSTKKIRLDLENPDDVLGLG